MTRLSKSVYSDLITGIRVALSVDGIKQFPNKKGKAGRIAGLADDGVRIKIIWDDHISRPEFFHPALLRTVELEELASARQKIQELETELKNARAALKEQDNG